ncbi:hypothetical protein KBX37_21945 [Micromonospora sp. U56]|nr:hypothetical protein [Micromonospora sp. U56]
MTDCTAAIRAAISACHDAGGGRVVVPAGRFATGAVHLLSDVNLHLTAGATPEFNRDPSAYLPVVHTRYEGVELLNYSPFIYAYGQRNVAVTGAGVIDGRADAAHWWDWTGGPPPNEGPDKTLSTDPQARVALTCLFCCSMYWRRTVSGAPPDPAKYEPDHSRLVR